MIVRRNCDSTYYVVSMHHIIFICMALYNAVSLLLKLYRPCDTHLHVHTDVCTHTHRDAHAHTHISTHVLTYSRIHTHTHKHTHVHVHVYCITVTTITDVNIKTMFPTRPPVCVYVHIKLCIYINIAPYIVFRYRAQVMTRSPLTAT